MDRKKIIEELEEHINGHCPSDLKRICHVSLMENVLALLKEQEVRLLTEEEATEWCEDYNGETVRTKPLVEECLRPFDKAHWFEWISPDDDYFTVDIVGYNEQIRLWTGMPTEEQWKAEKWKTQLQKRSEILKKESIVKELLPCKKCGYPDWRHIQYVHPEAWRISCTHCGYCTKEKKTKEEAEEAWNKR